MEVGVGRTDHCSTNQKQAWIRLMINALETNFFYYKADPSKILTLIWRRIGE